MNTTMIETGRADAINVFCKEMGTVNHELIDLQQKLYDIELTHDQISRICAMSYLDKIWLIAQYKRDIRMTERSPDLSALY